MVSSAVKPKIRLLLLSLKKRQQKEQILVFDFFISLHYFYAN